jgi:hypothetical protein
MMRPAILAALLLFACGPNADDPGPFEAVGDVKQIMTAILEPAAEVYWDAAGSIVDERGVHELAPTTDEEWGAVGRAALVIAESGNLLMLEGRARDGDAWMTLSRALVAVGKEAMAAAARRDPAAVLEVGGQVYEACTACHAAYALETLRPSHSPTAR